MARGVASPAPNALPKVSFTKVADEVNQKNPGVYDHVARTYGCEFLVAHHALRWLKNEQTTMGPSSSDQSITSVI